MLLIWDQCGLCIDCEESRIKYTGRLEWTNKKTVDKDLWSIHINEEYAVVH